MNMKITYIFKFKICFNYHVIF